MDGSTDTPVVVEPETPPEQRSTVQLVRDISSDTTALIRKEIELARIEIVEALVARAKAAGAMAAAGLLALFAMVFFGIAGYRGLTRVVPDWAAALIVAGAFVLIALAAVLFGARRVKQPPMAPEETQRTVKEDVQWAKAQLKK